MAKEAYYFSHDSNARNDIKLVRLRRKAGLCGLGIYWCIIEMLRESADYKLPLSAIDDIAYDINASRDDVNCVIREYDLFEVTETHFYSNRLIRSMLEYESILEKRRQAGILGGQASVKQRLSKRQANVNDCSTIKGKEIKGNNIPLPPNGEVSEEFERFWDLYDKKVDRSKCEKKFKNLSKAERESIFQHVPEYVASTPDSQYRKNPYTYLNGKCWRDQIIKKPVNGITHPKMVY